MKLMHPFKSYWSETKSVTPGQPQIFVSETAKKIEFLKRSANPTYIYKQKYRSTHLG